MKQNESGRTILLILGCSSVVALTAFLIVLVLSMFGTDSSWRDQLTVASMIGVITFFAAWLLFTSDSVERSVAWHSARKHLLSRVDTNTEDFLSVQPFDSPELLLETRSAISRFFDVPIEKIYRDVRLIETLKVDKLAPSFQFYVVDLVIASQECKPKPFAFSMAGLNTIDELTDAIRKVIVVIDQAADDRAASRSESQSTADNRTTARRTEEAE